MSSLPDASDTAVVRSAVVRRAVVRSAVVLGARRTGGAIVDHLLADGWRVTAVARSASPLRAADARGARAVRADAADPRELREVLADARAAQGGLDLVVNAVAPSAPPGPFGGGPIADADLATFRAWAVAVAEQTFVFLNAGADALRPDGGTLIQLTGGSSLRAKAGGGSWAAGAFATRALVHAAANELRDDGVHVALAIIDGTIGSDVERAEIASTVAFLADPGQRRRMHEVRLSPAGGPWIP